jgi:hypothetical protein
MARDMSPHCLPSTLNLQLHFTETQPVLLQQKLGLSLQG